MGKDLWFGRILILPANANKEILLEWYQVYTTANRIFKGITKGWSEEGVISSIAEIINDRKVNYDFEIFCWTRDVIYGWFDKLRPDINFYNYYSRSRVLNPFYDLRAFFFYTALILDYQVVQKKHESVSFLNIYSWINGIIRNLPNKEHSFHEEHFLQAVDFIECQLYRSDLPDYQQAGKILMPFELEQKAQMLKNYF